MADKVFDLELSEGVSPVWGLERYDGVCVLVRYYRKPVGWVYITGLRQPLLSAERLREAIHKQLGRGLVPILLGRQIFAEVAARHLLPPLSVVVCARDWGTQLDRCLRALVALDYPNYEIIVVDSTQSDDIAHLALSLSVRYVREGQPGLARARNRGLAEARHDIVAFIADSAWPDRCWLQAIGCAFAESEVMAVTGLVAPAELETPAQFRLEFDYGKGGDLRRRTIRREWLTTQELLWAYNFGSGANMAFRRQVFTAIGSFDVAFDVEPLSNGVGDIELLHRLVARGRTLRYEPTAIVWHTHERDIASLPRLVYDRSRSFGAYLLTCARNRTVSRLSVLHFALRNWIGREILHRLYRPGKLSRRLLAFEFIGAIVSPLAYRKVRKHVKRAVADTKEPPGVPDTLSSRKASVQPGKPQGSRTARRRRGVIRINVIRTWYPHWGAYAGINQFLRYVDEDKYDVRVQLVQENDNDFPIRNKALREFLRRTIQERGMPWYNLSDFTAEMKAFRYYWYKGVDILHFLDGEHAAQFLPKLAKLPRGLRPKVMVTYHQPPEVLNLVIKKDILPKLDCITIVAPEQCSFFTNFVSPERVRLIPHGIDVDFFRPISVKKEDGRFRCVSVGHNYRDYRTVREVALKLRDEKNVEFHVVSPRPTGLEDLPNVTMYKGIDDAQLLNLYQQADLLFLPLLKATANNALLEGAACGLPILSTVLPSVKAYLPGNEAILVEGNDPQQFVDAILHLVQDPHLRQTMAAKARQRAEELDWRRIAPQYEAIYSQLAGQE